MMTFLHESRMGQRLCVWVSERKLRVKDDEREGFLLKMTKRERAVFGNLKSISLRREKKQKKWPVFAGEGSKCRGRGIFGVDMNNVPCRIPFVVRILCFLFLCYLFSV